MHNTDGQERRRVRGRGKVNGVLVVMEIGNWELGVDRHADPKL